MEYLPPRYDSVFKALFGDKNHKEFILSFLKSFLECPGDELFKVKFSDPLFPIECKNGKYCTLDLLIETKSGHKINVEMQNSDLNGFDKRAAYYLSRLASKQLSQAESYEHLNRSIVIFILNYEMKPERFNNSFKRFDSCLSNWRLRNKRGEELTDSLEVNIIELPKVPKAYKNNFFYDWLSFIRADKKEEFEMIEEKTECKELKDAIVTLRRLSGSELQQAIFEAELDAKRLKNAEISTAKEEGMKEGIKKGVEKGIKKGIKEGIKEGIKKGKKEGIKEGVEKGIKEGIKKGVEKGIKEGEIKSKIEAVINLVLATKMSIEDAIKILKVDSNYKKQIEKKLKRLGI